MTLNYFICLIVDSGLDMDYLQKCNDEEDAENVEDGDEDLDSLDEGEDEDMGEGEGDDQDQSEPESDNEERKGNNFLNF